MALGDGGISAVGATRDAADDEAEARRDERDQWQTATHKAERVAEQVEQVQQLIATAEQEAARRFKIAAGLTLARQAQETAEKAAREALEMSKIEAGAPPGIGRPSSRCTRSSADSASIGRCPILVAASTCLGPPGRG